VPSVVLVKALCKVWLKKVLWVSWIKSKLKVYKTPTAKRLARSKPTVQLKLEIKQLSAAEAARVQQMTEAGNQFAAGQGISQLSVLVPQALKHLLVMVNLVVKQIFRTRSYLKLLAVQTKLKVSRVLILGTKST
jgi:hypothetical protein